MTVIKQKENGNSNLFPWLKNDFFGNTSFPPTLFDLANDFWNSSFKMPAVNISEKTDEYCLDLSAPGLNREDFKVEINENVLTISCEKEKKEETKGDKENFNRREFSYSSFSRSFELPKTILENKIHAKYDNGVLHVCLPKKEAVKAKKSIQVS